MMFRFLFPSFERPVARQKFTNVTPETRDFRGVGTVLLIAATCGVGIALWEPSQQLTSPFSSNAVTRPASEVAKVASADTTASAEADEDQSTPTVRLSAQCAQRATARRDCANAKAFRETRLKAPATIPAKPQQVATKKQGQPAAKT